MEKLEAMLNGFQEKDVEFLLFVQYVMVRVNIVFGSLSSVKSQPVRMILNTSALATIAMVMAGSVSPIGLKRKWGGMTLAVPYALTKLGGQATNSGCCSRSGEARNHQTLYGEG